MAVGVAHVAADLAAAVDRRGQKLRSARAPLRVDGADVGDADVEKARGAIGIRGRLQRHGRLVVGRSSADADGDPAVCQRHNRKLAPKDPLAAEHLNEKAPGRSTSLETMKWVSAIPSVGAGNCAICLLLPL